MSVATTVTEPADTAASVADFEPSVSVLSASTFAAVDVTRDLVTLRSENVAPISVTDTVSPPTALPKTSVAETEIVGAVFTADDAGTTVSYTHLTLPTKRIV